MIYPNNLDWMQYQGFKGLTKDAYSKALLGHHSITEGIQLAVICKNTNTLAGDLYLNQEEESCWIGYAITPLMARRGYAYEAVSSILNFLATQGITSIKAGIERGNHSSAALLKKLNFRFLWEEDGELVFGLNSALMRLLK